jgi:hypothetical protein
MAEIKQHYLVIRWDDVLSDQGGGTKLVITIDSVIQSDLRLDPEVQRDQYPRERVDRAMVHIQSCLAKFRQMLVNAPDSRSPN